MARILGGDILTTEEKVLSCISRAVEIDLTEEDYSMNLVDDFGVDSILLMEIVLAVEDDFDISFSDFTELSAHMDSIGALVNYLCEVVEREGGYE